MKTVKPRYGMDEFAQRGQTFYEKMVKPSVTEADRGKFVAIDIETGAYEIDEDDFLATEKLLQHLPDAQIWLCRVGHRAAYKI
ncbi:MAG: hypothetical protein C4527_08300 [Candidatus Omnitrophota bacterium]|jgi:hypothetical protein|nr:MAG: hypothetical protein C4527_08300 [Candidatus Omnitrophota bacterium]